MRIREITLYRVDLPLTTPYRLSYRTFESFEPLLAELRDEDGRIGWGEQHISPGSSAETRDGGWAFAKELAAAVVGENVEDARCKVRAQAAASPVAATALVTAMEMLQGAAVLRRDGERCLPLLTAFNATEREAIKDEVEQRLAEDFRTFKVKVGKDVDADIARFAWIQECLAGRATLRVDANRAFSREEGCRFAEAMAPDGVELFEQPCAAEDWEANAAVAAISPVPLMLDEPICSLADIDRAAGIDGVGLCKVKLKRFGSLDELETAIRSVQAKGLAAVLGDGLGAEINCWMEACVADGLIDNAGEFNGYVKVRPEARLLTRPLPFAAGKMVLPADWWPEVDRRRLAAQCLQHERFASPSVGAFA